jgi:hypothetical protein
VRGDRAAARTRAATWRAGWTTCTCPDTNTGYGEQRARARAADHELDQDGRAHDLTDEYGRLGPLLRNVSAQDERSAILKPAPSPPRRRLHQAGSRLGRQRRELRRGLLHSRSGQRRGRDSAGSAGGASGAEEAQAEHRRDESDRLGGHGDDACPLQPLLAGLSGQADGPADDGASRNVSPSWCVSFACVRGDVVEMDFVMAPARDELFVGVGYSPRLREPLAGRLGRRHRRAPTARPFVCDRQWSC